MAFLNFQSGTTSLKHSHRGLITNCRDFRERLGSEIITNVYARCLHTSNCGEKCHFFNDLNIFFK